jgi:ATP-dependent Clp protease ATP-binding subunit ClpX
MQFVVDVIISGTNAFICNECVHVCGKIIKDWDLSKQSDELSILYPKYIKEKFDATVISQEKAKIALSVAAFMHSLRINHNFGTTVPKSNMLMYGPTGCGKTFLVQTLANILRVPMVVVDATTLTEAGYVGEDVESMLLRLLQATNYNVAQAERGIICIDEIDKLARSQKNRAYTRDVSGEGVQQALLKLIEGKVASVPRTQNKGQPSDMIQINTSNILFIGIGAFTGLEEIVAKRVNKNKFGLASNNNNHEHTDEHDMHTAEMEDLIAFGMIPELVGRMPVRVPFHKLSTKDLVHVASYGDTSLLSQYRNLLFVKGIDLTVSDDAIEEIAKMAHGMEAGARSLKTIFEELLMNRIFNIDPDAEKNAIDIQQDDVRKTPSKV